MRHYSLSKKNKSIKSLQSEKLNVISSSLEITGLEYHQPTSSKSKNGTSKNEFIMADPKNSYSKEPHFALSNHSKLDFSYSQKSHTHGNNTLSDSGVTLNYKTKRNSTKSLWRRQKEKESLILLSPTREKLHDYLFRKRRCSDSPQHQRTSRSSSRCKENHKKSRDLISQQKYSKLSKNLTKLNSKSENLKRSRSPTIPLNQLDNTWNRRFLNPDISLSDEDNDLKNISDRENCQWRHCIKHSNEKDIRRKRRRLAQAEKLEHLKNKDLFQNVKIRRPSLLPAPATLEEHIDKL